MNIEKYLSTQVFAKRLDQRVFVVYDEAHCYRAICLSMASDFLTVVDTSASSIESRELALQTLVGFGQGGHKLLIYVPTAIPMTDDDKQKDPSVFTVLVVKYFLVAMVIVI